MSPSDSSKSTFLLVCLAILASFSAVNHLSFSIAPPFVFLPLPPFFARNSCDPCFWCIACKHSYFEEVHHYVAFSGSVGADPESFMSVAIYAKL